MTNTIIVKYNPESSFALNIMKQKYSHTLPNGEKETWEQIAKRVTENVLSVFPDTSASIKTSIFKAIRDRKFLPGGRYLYASGRDFHQVQNCLLLRADDSREGWSELLQKASMALMTGAGIGVDYSDVREEGALIRKTGGFATGPLALMKMVNESGRYIMQGGARRSAIWAGLNWDHPDIMKFIQVKDWSGDVRKLKDKDFNFPATLDGTNISTILKKGFFEAYHDTSSPKHAMAYAVYWETVKQMVQKAEPGISVDYDNPRDSLRNACCEISSEDDSDICNLGSINMANVSSIEEMRELTKLGTLFLMAGTVYSDVPYAEVDKIRRKNRRLGLGIMGVHEFLLKRGEKYGETASIQPYLEEYVLSGEYAKVVAKKQNISAPVKTRAIAPTGTIGIIAETTTGIEPIFCVAYKRRYLKHTTWHYEYVIDPCAKRLIENEGIHPEAIEDAYTLSENIETRVKFQAYIQKYVDHGISSTINLPAWGSKGNNESTVEAFGNMLLTYLPHLRGITCYPDGARGGQPLTPVKYTTAIKNGNQVFVEQADMCDISGKGSCNE